MTRLRILLITLATAVTVGASYVVAPAVATVAIQSDPQRECQ